MLRLLGGTRCYGVDFLQMAACVSLSRPFVGFLRSCSSLNGHQQNIHSKNDGSPACRAIDYIDAESLILSARNMQYP